MRIFFVKTLRSFGSLAPPNWGGSPPITNHPFDALNACSGRAFHFSLRATGTPQRVHLGPIELLFQAVESIIADITAVT